MDAEREWVAAALQGDEHAFSLLVDAYKMPVYNVCHRMLGNPSDAEDAAQETFVRVYTHLRDYDPRQKLSSWILAVASHYCIDRLRRQRVKLISLDAIGTLGSSRDERQPESQAMKSETCAEIRDLLQSLPAEYRLVIALRYWQDLSYADIAQVVGTTESAVKSRLHRARTMLAEQVRNRRTLEGQPGNPVASEKRMVTNAVLKVG